jgi:hypothetical protein
MSGKLVSKPGSNTKSGKNIDELPCEFPTDISELFADIIAAGSYSIHAPEDSSSRNGTRKKKLTNRESSSNYRQRKMTETNELKRRCKAAEDMNDLLQQMLRRCMAKIRRLEEATSKQT